MKTRKIWSVLIVFTLLFEVFSANAQKLLKEPQKIVIDAKRNRLLVSNYGDGSIVQIDANGNQSYFIQDAGFVDGLEIVGDSIYGVGNDRMVYGYNLETKEQVMNIKIEGADDSYYLSSITYDSIGHLFISCPYKQEIYKLRISNNTYTVFAEKNGMNNPNGILLERDKNRILVIDDANNAKINAISLSDSSVTRLMTTTFYNPDGITRDKNGYYYVGGYYLPGLYRIDPNFAKTPELIFSGSHMVYPTYDERDHSLLITYYDDNEWGRVLLDTNTGNQALSNLIYLYQNYPNPFSEKTSITFTLLHDQHVVIDIYNCLGAKVAELGDSIFPVGENTVNFNANDLSSGIYYYILKTRDFSITKKMVIKE